MCKKLFVVLLVGAMPATVLANINWLGITNVWDETSNWSVPGNFGNLAIQHTVTGAPGGGPDTMPVISAGTETDVGYLRLREGGVITQTGGLVRWRNSRTDRVFAMNLFGVPGATLHITGGVHQSRGRVGIGRSQSTPYGTGTVNVWESGTFYLRANDYTGSVGLEIHGEGSLIDIRDDGVLIAPIAILGDLQGYEAAGKLVAGEPGYWLDYTECHVNPGDIRVTAIPEPAALLLLGLGGLMFVRRRRA